MTFPDGKPPTRFGRLASDLPDRSDWGDLFVLRLVLRTALIDWVSAS